MDGTGSSGSVGVDTAEVERQLMAALSIDVSPSTRPDAHSRVHGTNQSRSLGTGIGLNLNFGQVETRMPVSNRPGGVHAVYRSTTASITSIRIVTQILTT